MLRGRVAQRRRPLLVHRASLTSRAWSRLLCHPGALRRKLILHKKVAPLCIRDPHVSRAIHTSNYTEHFILGWLVAMQTQESVKSVHINITRTGAFDAAATGSKDRLEHGLVANVDAVKAELAAPLMNLLHHGNFKFNNT